MIDGLREHTIQEGLGICRFLLPKHFRRDEVRVLDTGMTTGNRWQPRCRQGRMCAALHRASSLRHGFEWIEIVSVHGLGPSILSRKARSFYAAPVFGGRPEHQARRRCGSADRLGNSQSQ